ncbi:20923_t:CDS:2 [Gigaspora rosea]|nr:20923_t:CDS:2 [Gigaspora rosea]
MKFHNETEIEDVYICLFERSHNIDSEETNLEAETNKRNTVKNKPLNNEIPSMSTSNFIPFRHSYPEHKSSPNSNMFMKLEPLASHVRNISQQLFIPNSNLAVNEMIARFLGRSAHTFRIKNKPTPEGYRILSLCDSEPSNVDLIPNINKTGAEVYHLVQQLPNNKSFNIFMDNYFSSINLFNFLHEKGYGACGIVVNNVLVLLWIDNGPVTMLTTIHVIERENSKVERERRQPRITNANSQKLRAVFGDSVRKKLLIPKAINDYNFHMGGVDIADQLHNYYSTQLIVRRTWVPLFFWLLDTSLINAYLICKNLTLSTEHKKFRMELVHYLIKDATSNPLKRITRREDKYPIEEEAECSKKYKVSEISSYH